MPLTTKGKMQSILDNLLIFDNNCILVDSNNGNDSNSGKNTWNNALASWDAAYAKCTENNADKIILAPGHAETWSTTGAKVTGDKAGVEVIALGKGADKATITVTHTGAYATFTSNNQAVKGVRFVSGVDSITKFINVSGNDCEINIDSIDDSSNEYEVITDIVNSGDRNNITVRKQGFITGNANDCIVSCNGCNGGDIKVIGDITANVTAIIEFVTAASSNINIELFTLVNGITDLSQNIVDTITGSTYNAKGFDKGAGANFSGNESAMQVDDIGAVTAALAVVDTVADAIKAVTDNIPDTGALTTLSGKIDTIDGLIDAVKLITDALPDAGALSTIDGKLDTIDTVVDAIKVITDALPDSGALTALLADIASILTDTGTTLPASLSGLETKIDTIDTVVDAIKVITDAIPDSGALTTLLSNISDILTDTGTTLPATLSTLDTKVDYAIGNQAGGFNSLLGKRVARSKADVLDGVQNAIFNITGDVLITHIEALIEDGAVDNEVVNTKLIFNSTSYGDTDLCANTDLDSAAVGTKLGITGTFTDALQTDANGALKIQEGITLKGGGSIDILSSADGGGDNSATVSFIIWYLPLSNDGVISAAA